MKSITSQLCILNPRPSPPFSPPLQPLCRANNQFVFNHRSFHRRHVVLFANIIIIRCQTFRLALTPIIFLLALHCKEYISEFLAQRFYFLYTRKDEIGRVRCVLHHLGTVFRTFRVCVHRRAKTESSPFALW